jgi:hypothetical protein
MVNAFALEFALRYMLDAAHLFGDDYDCAIIFLAVLEGNGRQNIRDPSFRVDYADVRVSLPAEMARPMSRKSIADSLGMARETARRKIAALIEKGYLVNAPRGGVITTRGVIANPDFLAAQARVVGYVRQFRRDLRTYARAPEEQWPLPEEDRPSSASG